MTTLPAGNGPRVALYSADETGCGRYRMIYPAQVLAAAGHDVAVYPPGHDKRLHAVLKKNKTTGRQHVTEVVMPDADVLVFQRPLSRLWAEAMGALKRTGRYRIVIELDDDFRATSHANAAYNGVHPARSVDANWNHLATALKHADALIASTPSIAKRYGVRKETHVVRNRVPAWMLDLPHDPGPARLGWAGAVETHPFDLQQAGVGIAQALAGGLLHVVGPDTKVAESTGLRPDQVAASGWVPVAEYPRWLAEHITVGISPLEDTVFNRGKSWLKPLEMAACGIQSVVTPLPEYQELIDLGIGLPAKKPLHWRRQIERLMGDHDFRASESERIRRVVADAGLTVEATAHEWWQAWTGQSSSLPG